jgi:hypothetical protein
MSQSVVERFPRLEYKADQVIALIDEGKRRPLAVNLEVGEKLTGLAGSDLLRAAYRGELDARRYNGRIVVLYDSLEKFILNLEYEVRG